MAGQTLVEKIVTRHAIARRTRPLRAGDVAVLRPRHVMSHDNSLAILDQFRRLGMKHVRYPWQPLLVLDHDIQNPDPARLQSWRDLAEFARAHRLEFRACGSGIGHELMVSEGFVVPGSLCVAADSHANTYGALGALGTALVRSDAAVLWATGEFWWELPPTVEVVLHGRLGPGVTAKDLALSLLGHYGDGEVHEHAVEFTGPGVAHLDVDERLTLANLTTEWGAVAGVFPVDAVTVAWLENVRRENAKRGARRFGRAQLEQWATQPLRADPDADYAARIEVELDSIEPVMAGPDSVSAVGGPAAPLRIDKAFLVGCANTRLSDLRAAAQELRGRKVSERVRLYVAAASAAVQEEAVREGVWQTLLDAGARTLPPGCAMCIGLGEGILEPGEVAVSATNRNFPGRMGSVDASAWLASPAAVARAAIAGEIPAGRALRMVTRRAVLERRHRNSEPAAGAAPLPAIRGRAWYLPVDDLDTDRIYPSTAVYRTLPPERMAELLLQHHDADLAARLRPGDVVIGGRRFGVGSSREQAVTAFVAAGVRAIVAGSFGRSFRRNAAHHALPCIEAPEFVEFLRERHAATDARALLLDAPVEVDFAAGRVHALDRSFGIEPMPEPVRDLLASGGLFARVRRRFGLPVESA